MTEIIGVRFKQAGKIYYFSPDHHDIHKGDQVIVETSRGIEFGECVIAPRMMEDALIAHPLKPILRIADDHDRAIQEVNRKKAKEALPICEEKIRAHKLEMKLVDAEYTFENNKLIFYFTADGRVDFRELVKDLASTFRIRIELRQIGVRDESKMVKGLGPCGREVCCGSWLGDFAPVSIKMAKDQNLSLNPIKISGLCSRLMCCLNYEHETYVQIRVGMPNIEDKVETPSGRAVVVGTNIIKEEVTVRHFTGQKNELSTDLTVYRKDEIHVIEKSGSREKVDYRTERELKNLED